MSDAAFEDFTKQVLELSYEQTLTLMEKMLESLKTKRREKNYSEMEKDMGISRLDPETGDRTTLAEKTRCFEKDKFGHITGDRPQVVGSWLYYKDAETKEIVCLELA